MPNDPFSYLDQLKQYYLTQWKPGFWEHRVNNPYTKPFTLPQLGGMPKQSMLLSPFPKIPQPTKTLAENQSFVPAPNITVPPTPGPVTVPPPKPTPTAKPKLPKPSVPPTTNPNPTGSVYYPKPQGSSPVVFPGITASGSGWAKFQDGSFVNYSHPNWQKTAAYVPPSEQADLWASLPDSWKVDMASNWQPEFIKAYLEAMSNPHALGYFQGKQISGQEAAQEIVRMAREAHGLIQKGRTPPPAPKGIEFKNAPGFVPSPYLK